MSETGWDKKMPHPWGNAALISLWRAASASACQAEGQVDRKYVMSLISGLPGPDEASIEDARHKREVATDLYRRAIGSGALPGPLSVVRFVPDQLEIRELNW